MIGMTHSGRTSPGGRTTRQSRTYRICFERAETFALTGMVDVDRMVMRVWFSVEQALLT